MEHKSKQLGLVVRGSICHCPSNLTDSCEIEVLTDKGYIYNIACKPGHCSQFTVPNEF